MSQKSYFSIAVKIPSGSTSCRPQIPVATAEKIIAAVEKICAQDLAAYTITHDGYKE